MRPLVECVPNFSEGRNEKVINAITDAIKAVSGVKLSQMLIPASAQTVP